MDAAAVRTVLRRVGLEPQAITPIAGGWANWTFDLDGTHIVRFPRNDSIGLSTHRELLLLPELHRHLSFEVPQPTHVGTWRDRPFFAYRRIDGVALGALDRPAGVALVPAIGRLLHELHRFPVEQAAFLLRLGPPKGVWEQRFEELWTIVEEVALPELPPATADEVRRRYHALLDDPPAFPHALVHNDLGPEHLLVRPSASEEPALALIDFEDATIGDPAVDLTFLASDFGADALPALLAGRDLGERLGERLSFYRWMGSVHAVIYGVLEGVDVERTGGVKELERRLAVPPLAI